MATLPTLYGASPLDADDTTYDTSVAQPALDVNTHNFDNVPANFDVMETGLQFTVTSKLTNAPGGDTYEILIAIVNSAQDTVLAGSSSTYDGTGYTHAQQVTGNVATNSDQTDGPTSFTYVNTTASKTDWDNGLIQMVYNTANQDKGPDNNSIDADHVYFTGSYTALFLPRVMFF